MACSFNYLHPLILFVLEAVGHPKQGNWVLGFIDFIGQVGDVRGCHRAIRGKVIRLLLIDLSEYRARNLE